MRWSESVKLMVWLKSKLCIYRPVVPVVKNGNSPKDGALASGINLYSGNAHHESGSEQDVTPNATPLIYFNLSNGLIKCPASVWFF